jgi:hypothetical protein
LSCRTTLANVLQALAVQGLVERGVQRQARLHNGESMLQLEDRLWQ